MRKRIYEIIEPADQSDKWSNLYDIFMMIMIAASMVPLAFKQSYPVFQWIDGVTVTVFIIDYILRFFTADYKLPRRKKWAFVLYPFTPMAIIDLLSILPSLTFLADAFRLLKLLRLFRSLRVLRAFKFIRYSKSAMIILEVFRKQKKVLLTVATLAIFYVFISALVIFNVEPESFQNFFDAIYWATVSLTTVGYGDIYPVSDIGRLVTMISSVFGIAVIALPSGIITAGYINEIHRNDDEEDRPQ